jgi:tetratricopeptide (TPR) repeat protein
MKKIVILLTMVTALVFLLYSGVTSGKGRMQGIVTDEDTGAPIEGVTVKLYFPDQEAYHRPFPKTDKDGKWRVLYVRKGTWYLDFEKEGYDLKRISFFVDPTPGSKNPPIEMKLKKLEGPVVAAEVVEKIDRARVLIDEKQYDKALDTLTEIKEKHKDNPGIDIVYLYIGNIYAAQGNYRKAIEYYKISVEKFPDNRDLILSVGNAYNNLNDYDKAMEWYAKLGTENIGDAVTLYNIGAIAYNKGDYNGALTYFQKAIEIEGDFADAFFQLGMTYTALSKQGEAVAALKKFMELAPDSANFETAQAIVAAFEQAK